ncbi:MAG: hypothetical protein ACOYD0_10235 [Candidatus Nanopelagicales bacterium]
MRIANRTLVLATSAAAAVVLLTACSSNSSSSSSASPTNSASASESTGNSVPAPIEVTGAGDLTVKVGNTLNVTTADATTIATNNTSVLRVSAPRSEGGASFNGGAVVVGQGTAKLTVSGDSGVLYVVNVTAAGSVPSISPGSVG